MNCRTITIFGARFAPQRLRPFRDRSLTVPRPFLGREPTNSEWLADGRLGLHFGLEFGHRNMSVREVPICTFQIFYAPAFMKGRGSKAEEAAYCEAASGLLPWRHLDRDMRRGANHLDASIRNKAPERFQH